jgi:hypothetical protein
LACFSFLTSSTCILDWLIVCKFKPRWVIVPGTEHIVIPNQGVSETGVRFRPRPRYSRQSGISTAALDPERIVENPEVENEKQGYRKVATGKSTACE